MGKGFGETVREMREAQGLGLRIAADRLEISPAYLSRIERGRENPPKPEIIKRMATLLGGDPDALFRLADSTDPDLTEYLNLVPNAPDLLRVAKDLRLTSDDFAELISYVKRQYPSSHSRHG